MAVAAVPTTPKPVTTPGPARLPFQIPSLDGLRAVSFLMVFAAHAGVEAIPGGFGVTVFFFLSGYLITTLMRLEAEKTGGVSLKNFYYRRALRILPPFYIVLFVATTLAAMGFLNVQGAEPPRLLPVASQILHFLELLDSLSWLDGNRPRDRRLLVARGGGALLHRLSNHLSRAC